MKRAVSHGDALVAGHATVVPLTRARPVPALEAAPDVLRLALARLDGATDLATAARFADVCVPTLADSAAVQLLAGPVHGDDAVALPPGSRLLVHAAVGGSGTGWGRAQALPAESALREAIESRHVVHREAQLPASAGSTTLHLDLDPVLDAGEDRDRPRALAPGLPPDLRPGSSGASARGGHLVVAPLLCRGVPLGVLVLRRDPGRPRWSGGDVATIEELAAVAALRLDDVRLSARRAATSAALRSSLLPAMPKALTAVDVGVRYRTARAGDGVGGDWLSVIRLPGGRTGFTVGDVMGHGTAAAVVMGVLRSALQALAPLLLDPGQVLRQLDDLAVQYQADRPDQENWLATCVYAVYDPVTGICEMASAGHPPPVLTAADGTSRLLGPEPGTPIGVGVGRYRTSRVPVPAGSQLVLYTDGLIEVRGRDIGEGMDTLRSRASAGRRWPLDQLCQRLFDQVEPSDDPDDVSLLVARFPGLPVTRVARWTFAADPGLAGHAGWLTDRALRRWGLHRALRTVVPLSTRWWPTWPGAEPGRSPCAWCTAPRCCARSVTPPATWGP